MTNPIPDIPGNLPRPEVYPITPDQTLAGERLTQLHEQVATELHGEHPGRVIDTLISAGGSSVGTEAAGYNLAFFEQLWPQLSDDDRRRLAGSFVFPSTLFPGGLIADATWDTPEGTTALLTWAERYETAEVAADTTLIGQATELLANGPETRDMYDLHHLADRLEGRMAERWEWHRPFGRRDYADECIQPLTAANLEVRLTDARTALDRVEAAPLDPADADEAALHARRTLRTLNNLLGNTSGNFLARTTQATLEAQSLADLQEEAEAMRRRLHALTTPQTQQARQRPSRRLGRLLRLAA